jgi:para-aminobenzoate synthetase component I
VCGVIGQRAYLGPALGGPKWLEIVEQATPDVRTALRTLDTPAAPGELKLVMISYEAAVSLDPRAPVKPYEGPNVVVTRCVAGPPMVERASAPAIGERPGAHAAHLARVRAAKEKLLDGIIYQANLAHRLDVAPMTREEGIGFFTNVKHPTCSAYLDVNGWGSIISLSPEKFVTIENGVARSFPIKGTRPRGKTPDDDRKLLEELLSSTKDHAEHVMIVDLLRNDLGKIAIAGGVTVEKLMSVVSVENVHHLESTIAAKTNAKPSEIFEATLPGGSITGAPKSSAIETIYELEDGPRGPYTGTLIVVDEKGAVRSSLLIRTWLRPDGDVGALHVGGGIVVDSDPEEEWQETLAKARGFTR